MNFKVTDLAQTCLIALIATAEEKNTNMQSTHTCKHGGLAAAHWCRHTPLVSIGAICKDRSSKIMERR